MSIFVVQKATAPKSGVEFRQGSIGTISSSLATSCNVWQRCRVARGKNMMASGGWSGGRVVPGTFYSHFVVQLASLQDFQHSWNSQVGPSVAINMNHTE